MTRNYRLAVLECDTPFPVVLAERGTYGEVFRGLLTKGLGPKADDVKLDLTKWDVVNTQEYPNIEDIDGFLLTGSSTFLEFFYIYFFFFSSKERSHC